MAKETSVTLSAELEAFVRAQMESGAYTSASEVVCEALTRWRTRTARAVAC